MTYRVVTRREDEMNLKLQATVLSIGFVSLIISVAFCHGEDGPEMGECIYRFDDGHFSNKWQTSRADCEHNRGLFAKFPELPAIQEYYKSKDGGEDDLCNGHICYLVPTGKNRYELIDCPADIKTKLPSGAKTVCVRVNPEYWP